MLFFSVPKGKSLSAADMGDVGVAEDGVDRKTKGEVEEGLFVGLKVAPGDAEELFKLDLFWVFKELNEDWECHGEPLSYL